jgi:hypothetical protein
MQEGRFEMLRMIKPMCLLLSLPVSMLAQPLSTTDDSVKDNKKVHLSLSAEQHERFMELMQQRGKILRQLDVLLELQSEKEKEQRLVHNKLARDYQEKAGPPRSDGFDLNKMSLHIDEYGSKSKKALQLHGRLNSILSSIKTMLIQKQRQLDSLYLSLAEEFRIIRNDNYNYDMDNQIIYRVEQASGKLGN